MTNAHKIPLSIVSGFLGAGKTTFIKKLIREVYAQQKIVVLENEFGKIDLDSDNLSRERILVESIRDGCICCSRSDVLAAGVREIVEKHHPDRIIIEPTGLAKLTDVREALREPYVEEHCSIESVITIVDARNFHSRLNISKTFFEDQIAASRVVFLSRTEKLQKEQLAEVSESICSINPACEIIKEEWDNMTLIRLEEALALSSYTVAFSSGSDLVKSTGMFQNFALENKDYISLESITAFFEGLGKNEFGNIYRAKGIFQTPQNEWFTCEYVPGEILIRPMIPEMTVSGDRLRICVIGLCLNSGKMRNALTYNADLLTKQLC